MFPITKYYVRREKIKFIHKSEATAIKKKFHAKSDEKQKIFFCTPVSKFQKISTLNIYNEATKRNKKKILRRDTLRISEAVIWRNTVKKVCISFK